MSSVGFVKRILIAFGILFISSMLAGCKTASNVSSAVSNPKLENDPYFQEPPLPNEVFRVLIVDDNYIVKQVEHNSLVKRKEDAGGDKEMVENFKKFSSRYNFKVWKFTGMIYLNINPQTGMTEKLGFVSGHNPQSWQAASYLQDDASRFKFEFPDRRVTVPVVHVRYEWRIERRPGLSDEDARKAALDFLKNEKR